MMNFLSGLGLSGLSGMGGMGGLGSMLGLGNGGLVPELAKSMGNGQMMGAMPSALQGLQGNGAPNMMPGFGGIDQAAAAMQAGPAAAAMPPVAQMQGAVTTPYGLQGGPRGPGMNPAEQMSMGFSGGMPNVMPQSNPMAGMDPSKIMGLAGMMGGGRDEQQPRMNAPGGGIHRGQMGSMPEWARTQMMRRGPGRGF